LTLGLVAALAMTRSALGEVSAGYVTVLAQPFAIPLIVMSLLGGLFGALSSGISVARERELGTLETLFFGPITHRQYLLGKYLAHLALYTGMLAMFMVAIYLWALMTHLVFEPGLLGVAAMSIAAASAMIGLGLLAGTLMHTTRGTLFLLVGFVLVLLALQIGEIALTIAVSVGGIVSLVVLRDTVSAVNEVATWLSPLTYLLRGEEAALREAWLESLGYLAAVIGYGTVAMGVAGALLRRYGVMR